MTRAPLWPTRWRDRAAMLACFACLGLAGMEMLRPDLVVRFVFAALPPY